MGCAYGTINDFLLMRDQKNAGFLDSNIICSDYKMKSPSFEVAQKVGTIVLGQIVVDEVCNKYRENLEDKAAKTRKAIRDLNDQMFTPYIAWNELDVSDACSKYKDLT